MVGADVRRRGLVTSSPASAFTLIELLTVIAILGVLAALTVPVLKNFAKSDATIGASRQLLDAVARARQLAISQRTTVYMVFVPPDFWNPVWVDASGTPTPAWGGLTSAQQNMVTNNLLDKQLTGYNFLAYGAMGDQPGNHQWHYLDHWQTLPDGTFIVMAKFTNAPSQFYTINDLSNPGRSFNIYGFATNAVPFPTATNAPVVLPCVAFNYLGQLIPGADAFGNYHDDYIPLAKGSIIYAMDPATRVFRFAPPDVAEVPPDNSINAYNIVHIDRLTGRAVLEFQKVK